MVEHDVAAIPEADQPFPEFRLHLFCGPPDFRIPFEELYTGTDRLHGPLGCIKVLHSKETVLSVERHPGRRETRSAVAFGHVFSLAGFQFFKPSVGIFKRHPPPTPLGSAGNPGPQDERDRDQLLRGGQHAAADQRTLPRRIISQAQVLRYLRLILAWRTTASRESAISLLVIPFQGRHPSLSTKSRSRPGCRGRPFRMPPPRV
jgi:hypothetical protein